MANMSYCRFENTYDDLRDCYEALCETGSMDDLSETERRYMNKLIALCNDIANEFEVEAA